MLERGIQINHIKIAVSNPDFSKITFQGRVKVRKNINEHTSIEVIYFKDGFRGSNDIIIITAYYIEL